MHRARGAHELFEVVRGLRNEVEHEVEHSWQRWKPTIRRPIFAVSAKNLAAYVALRHHDLRSLQDDLAPWALSTLGRAETRVLPTLDALVHVLDALAHPGAISAASPPNTRGFLIGDRLLARADRAIFGRPPSDRRTRIMITLDAQAAEDSVHVDDLLRRGMDVARINCAHDDVAAWTAMIANVRAGSARVGRPCRVFVDIAGPKLRTAEVLAPDGFRMTVGTTMLLRGSAPQRADAHPVQMRAAIPEVLDALQIGHPVLIDDGRTTCVVRERVAEGLVLEVVRASDPGRHLREGRSLNVPASTLSIAPLTPKDHTDLRAIATLVDAIQYSFVQTPADVCALQDELEALCGAGALPGLVLKIETARAVHALPELIVQAGARQRVAVMIARGDLAVELGFERLAEIQEEIMWIAEAAHTPVIWATQVLERSIRKGQLSRAEITDAALSGRAECVMLNKGAHQLEAITILDDVLRRMQEHQWKKRPRLRALRSF